MFSANARAASGSLPCAAYGDWLPIPRSWSSSDGCDGSPVPPHGIRGCNAMGLWSALQDAMRTRRNRRIGLTEADRLVAGQPPGPDHRGLSVLLGAAAGPPSAEELAGERAAVARFVAANRGPVPLTTSFRVRPPRSARTVAIKLAAGVAVLATGGTAGAAETGNPPAGVQQRAHQL